MPTRKQRRRQQKERRHEYEYVYVDSEGNEVDVDPEEIAAQKPVRAAKADAAARKNGKAPDKRQRPRRVPQPPSWGRAVKRAALLGIFFVVVFGFVLRGKNGSLPAAVGVGLIYAVAFIPMQYLIDRFTYRMYLRRQAASPKPR